MMKEVEKIIGFFKIVEVQDGVKEDILKWLEIRIINVVLLQKVESI
jgi:hypothetical protein